MSPTETAAAVPATSGTSADPEVTDPARDAVREIARRAKVAARALATATRSQKDAALLAIADGLQAQVGRIVEANAEDLRRGAAEGLPSNLLDRLRLDAGRVSAIA